MKKVYTYLAAVAAALVVFSCQTVPHDDSHVDEVVSAPNVAISVSEITDFTATVTIAPEGAANYYAYMIDESDEAEELDPSALYANKYSSVANGLVKYATSGSTTVELEDLEPNTTYQVYAVAGSTTGVVGTVAVKSFLTTDNGTPTPGTPTKKENVLAVAFSEDVTYDATKPATAYYYAYNTAIIDKTDPKNPELVFDGKVGEAKVDVTVNGATATFTVTLDGTNPLPAGAYYTVGYPAGAFVDAVGNPCPIRTHLTGVTQDGNLGFAGFYGRVSTKAFDLEYDEEKETVSPSETVFQYGIPEGTEFYDLVKNAKATMTVISKGTSKVSTTVYDLEPDYDWFYSVKRNAIVVYYPDDIDINPGDLFKINIDEGAMQDVYGNANTAFEVGYLYSYGYDLEEIYGTYQNSGETIFSSKSDEEPWTFTLAETDDPTKGNLMITEYYGFDELEGIYANFDVDRGILTLPIHYSVFYLGGMVVGPYYYDFSAWSYNSTASEPTMTLSMTSLGEFASGNDYPGYVVDVYAMPESGNVEDIDPENDYLGYDFNMFYPEFSKVNVVGAPTVAPSSVKKPSFQILSTEKIKNVNLPLKK
jgi:hypothetical protein